MNNSFQTIEEIQNIFVSEFDLLEDNFSKYSYLVELSSTLEEMDASLKNDSNLISGCQSRVWLDLNIIDGKLHISADSDTLIIRGILAILVRVFTCQTPQEISDAGLFIFEKAGLTETFSKDRKHGISLVIGKIKECAQKHYQDEFRSDQQGRPALSARF